MKHQVSALREALRETTAVVHSLGWHDQRGWTAETCPIERCRRNRELLASCPARGAPGVSESRLSEPCRWYHGWNGWTNCVTHGWEGRRWERVRVGRRLVCGFRLAALRATRPEEPPEPS